MLLAAIGSGLGFSERTLSAESAARLISALDRFKREAHLRIERGVPFQSAFWCRTQDEIARMPLNQFVVQRGWVRYEHRESVIGFGTKASCPTMTLTPAGEAASAHWARGRPRTKGPSGRSRSVNVNSFA
jgi:hypothetical protein